MTKRLTFPKKPKVTELLFGQVDDICGRHSALVTKRNDGHHSLFSK